MGRDLSETELLRRAIDGRLLDVRTSIAGIVKSFDANSMTATVMPGVRVQAVDSDSSPEVDTLPDIEEVPVLFPHFGPFILYAPLSEGDIVRLEACEEDDSELYQDDGVKAPVSPTVLRRHGGAWVCRPEGIRGAGGLGGESQDDAFLGIPDGTGMSISTSEVKIGDSSATDFAALASVVNANFNAITNMFSTWLVVAEDGGGALKALTGSLVLNDVKASKVKVK